MSESNYKSVTELCADHENLGEYIAQLEGQINELKRESERRDQKDRERGLLDASFRDQLIKIDGMLNEAGIRSHWDYTSGITTSTRVKMLIERERKGKS